MPIAECRLPNVAQLYAMHFLSFQLIILFISYCGGFRKQTLNRFRGTLRNRVGEHETVSEEPLTLPEIEETAAKQGLKLIPTIIGPYLKLEAWTLLNNEKIGYLTAFIRPFPLGLLHLVKNRRQNRGELSRKTWQRSSEGISLLMGVWALEWARRGGGCRRAQLLAVKDTEKMNRILVRLYQRFGFKILREVEDNLIDRMTWGAEGTLMELDIEEFFQKWTRTFREMSQSFQNENEQLKGS